MLISQALKVNSHSSALLWQNAAGCLLTCSRLGTSQGLGMERTFAGRLVSTLEQTSGLVPPLHELEVEQISAAASLSVQ